MANVIRVVGGAGAGKTRYLVDRMAEAISLKVGVDEIGLISFTKAAANEVKERLGRLDLVDDDDEWGVPKSVEFQWVSTIHSCVFRCLGLKREQVMDVPEVPAEVSEAYHKLYGAAISVWGLRATLCGPGELEQRAMRVDSRLEPDLFWKYVEMYEFLKRTGHKLDFVDMLGLYAGVRFMPGYDPEYYEPEGVVPEMGLWFLDEQQDVSPLLNMVCKRLAGRTKYFVYLAGDPFQSIYGWAGATPKSLMGVDVDKEIVLRRSYRVPGRILRLGELVLMRCSDYWDRGIEAVRPGGEIEFWDSLDGEAVGGGDDVMVLSRTNMGAAYWAGRLNDMCIPWVAVGSGRAWYDVGAATLSSPWGRTKRNLALSKLLSLIDGGRITGLDWRNVVELFPVRKDGHVFFKRGVKADLERKKEEELVNLYPDIGFGDLIGLGATEDFVRLLRGGGWERYVDGGERFLAAVRRYGVDVVLNPRIRVGTIHSAKGREAKWVVLDSSWGRKAYENLLRASEAERDEERRVWYVGVTRASERLTILSTGDSRNENRTLVNLAMRV